MKHKVITKILSHLVPLFPLLCNIFKHISDFMPFYSYILHCVSLKMTDIFLYHHRLFITPAKINNNSWDHNSQTITKIPWLSLKKTLCVCSVGIRMHANSTYVLLFCLLSLC